MDIESLRLWIHRMEYSEKATTIRFKYDEYSEVLLLLIAEKDEGTVVGSIEIEEDN